MNYRLYSIIGIIIFITGLVLSRYDTYVPLPIIGTAAEVWHRIHHEEPPSHIPADTYEYSREQKRLHDLLTQEGSKAAYAYFIRAYAGIDPAIMHNLAHWIGSEIYRQEGAEGVILCDGAYQFGCYHGFFGTALSVEGNRLLPRAEQACMTGGQLPAQFGGCIHGIGHGILGLRGYGEDDLLKALEDCDLLSNASSQQGCYNGVFMEYNVRTMQGINGDEIAIRAFDATHPFDPCEILPSRYQPFCFYEQPAWWIASHNQTPVTSGMLCAALDNLPNREQCFRGIGRLMLQRAEGDHTLIRALCAELSSPEGHSACINEALRLLLSQGYTTGWEDLCAALTTDARTPCIAYAKTFLCSAYAQCE